MYSIGVFIGKNLAICYNSRNRIQFIAVYYNTIGKTIY